MWVGELNPLNPPTRGGLRQVAKFLSHHKVSQVGLTHFKPSLWWANLCELGWLTLTYLLGPIIYIRWFRICRS